ncbi:hypothetical protein KCU77_g12368, partial [Aureobasidium melanogenum]
MQYVETSAKSGENVERAFREVAERIYQNIEAGKYDLNDRRSGVKGPGASSGANTARTINLAMNDAASVQKRAKQEAYASLPSSRAGSEALDDEIENRNVSGLTAIKTIRALFCDRPECASEQAITELLSEASSETDQNVIRKMIIWSRELIRKYAKQDDGFISVIEHTTTQGLLLKLRKYTFNGADEDEFTESIVSPWPLIKKTTFGLDSPMLNDAIILMDLPGVRDPDSTRRRTVSKALAAYTHYLVVAQINRAQDDDTVTKYFAEGHNKKGSGRVIAAITNSDRIDGDMRNGNAEQQKQMEETKKKILSITGGLDQMRTKRKTATKQERLEIFEKEEEAYLHLTGDQRALPIFCVSNKPYEQYQIGFERSDRPVLTLDDTEMPKLRQNLRHATGEGRFNAATFHYEAQSPSLLSSVEIWCFKTHMKRRKELEDIVLEPREDLFTQIRDNIETEILILIKQKEKHWNHEATELCSAWATEHNSRVFRSFSKGQGYRKGTKAKSEISWNSALTKIMAQSLSSRCDKILDLLTDMESAVALDFESPISHVKEKVTADPEVVLMALKLFINKVEQQKPLMRNAVRECFRILRQNSMVGECMEDVYRSAHAITGFNPHMKRRAKLLDGIVGDASLWMAVHARASDRIGEILERRQRIFEKHVFGILTDIFVAFRASFSDKEAEEPAESALREQLTSNLAKAKEIYDGELRKAMKECREL